MQEASHPEIVLASQSPRRRELAEKEGWNVTVLPPPETAESEADPRDSSEPPEAWVARLAKVKAAAVVSRLQPSSGSIVLACDTVGVIDDEPLGKPVSRSDAAAMLVKLSGRFHRVLTGSCLWPADATPQLSVTESLLSMPPLTDAFLDDYLDSGLWQGKAGACGFQDGVIPLSLEAGSPSNVIGLPLETVRLQLAAFHPSNRPALPPAETPNGFLWFPASSFPEPAVWPS